MRPRTLQAIDSLLAAGNQEEALKLTERLIRKRPEDWEALVREGLALTGLDRPAEAARRFQGLLDLRANDDDPSVLVKATLEQHSPDRAMTTMNRRPDPIPIMGRTSMVYMMRALIGMDANRIFGSANSWYPADYGQARMLALAAALESGARPKRPTRSRQSGVRRGKRPPAIRDRPGTGIISRCSNKTRSRATRPARCSPRGFRVTPRPSGPS